MREWKRNGKWSGEKEKAGKGEREARIHNGTWAGERERERG